tara:strand:+ start:106 stop:255 length:150 start_codon:yes stop_codon:yes gene_type:complete
LITPEQENQLQILTRENSELQNKILKLKADFAALQSINNTMNTEIIDLK